MASADLQLLEQVLARLGDAVIDPAIWPELMSDICRATGATSSLILQSDVRTSDVPRTPDFDETVQVYFDEGWHVGDTRAVRGVPLLLAGQKVVIEEDILTPDQICKDAFYNDYLIPYDIPWVAGIGFRAGSALWALSLQRSSKLGRFLPSEKPLLASLSERLTEVATLSTAVGRVVLKGATNTLDAIARPAIGLDRRGKVLDINEQAATLFDDELHVVGQRLICADGSAQAKLDDFVNQMRVRHDTAPLLTPTILIRRNRAPHVIARVLPVPAAARNPFLGARALLGFNVLSPRVPAEPAVLMQAFGLSEAEARVASQVAMGASPDEIADSLNVSIHTVRSQLKSVFQKTKTGRQSELVALLAAL